MVARFLQARSPVFTDWWGSVLLGLSLVGVQWLFLHQGLGFESMRSDVLEYWEDSLKWREPYNSLHVPGYPLAIAAVRAPLDMVLQPVEIMLVTTLLAFAVVVTFTHKIAGTFSSQDARSIGILAAVLFVLWPFVGTAYVSYPVADMFGMAPFVVGWFLLLRQRNVSGGVFLGLALISHKAMWPFVGFLLLAHILSVRSAYSLTAGFVAALSLGVLWTLGALHHDSSTWIVSSNLETEIASSGTIPILDGLRGTFLLGGVTGLAKSATLVCITGVSVLVGIVAWRLPSENRAKWYMLAVPAAVLALVVILNEHEIWAAVRFSRLLAIPLAWLFGKLVLDAFKTSTNLRYSSTTLLALLFGSQFAFSYYMAKGFFT